MKEDEMGAYHLLLPCTAQLIQEDQQKKRITLIDRELPCFQGEEQEAKITRILPSAWTNIPDSVIEDQFQSRNEYKITDQVINRNWKKTIPSTKIQSHLEFEKSIEINTKTRPDAWKDLYLTILGYIYHTTTLITLVILTALLIHTMGQVRHLNKSVKEIERKNDEGNAIIETSFYRRNE
jgi:hypothetical protein